MGVPEPLALRMDNPRHGAPLLRFAPFVVTSVLSLGLLIVLVRSVDAERLAASLSHADRRLVIAALLPSLAILLLKVLRWRLLFVPDVPPNKSLFAALNVGYAVNTLVPARLGELVGAYWLTDGGGPSMFRTLSTVAVERVSDGLVLVALLVAVAPTAPVPRGLYEFALLCGAAFAIVLVAMVLVAIGSHRLDRLLARLLRPRSSRWHAVGRAVVQLIAGLRALQSPLSVTWFLFWTVVIWMATTLQVWLAVAALHIDLSAPQALLLTAVLFLGMAIPSSPGYLGVFDYLAVLVLGLYGVGRAEALAAALVLHVVVFLPVTVIGLGYILHGGVSRTRRILQATLAPSPQPGR